MASTLIGSYPTIFKKTRTFYSPAHTEELKITFVFLYVVLNIDCPMKYRVSNFGRPWLHIKLSLDNTE